MFKNKAYRAYYPKNKVAACPEVFRFNDDGEAEAYAEVAPEYEYAAEEARDACPVSVISLEG